MAFVQLELLDYTLVGTFEWPDISHLKRNGDDGDNEKDNGETEEKETQDDEAGNSINKGINESTSTFQSLASLKRIQQNIWQTTSEQK